MEARDRILHAALRVFAEAGSRGATTRRIAEAAGVNEVTLFRHFGNKDRLLREALREGPPRTAALALPTEPVSPEAELTRWCEEQMRHLFAARSVIRTCMGEWEGCPDLGRSACEAPVRVAGELVAYLERLRVRGWIEPDCDLPAAAALLMGAIFTDATGRDMMPQRFPHPMPRAAALYVRMFLRGVGAAGEQGDGPATGVGVASVGGETAEG